jgi:nitrogenase molybdenum-iron protein alpha/beta subunit
LEAVGAATGREVAAREFHGREVVILTPLLEKAPLRGVRVYLSLDPATALAVLDLVRELGGDIAGVSVDHLDRLHLTGLKSLVERVPALQIHVGHGQGFEELNLLQRLKPDLYIGAGDPIVQVARQGIPAVSLAGESVVGYRGMACFARKAVNALRNKHYIAGLADGGHPYAAAWFPRSPDWHIKQEVR